MSDFIYLRGLKRADFAVFSVADGQKRYYNSQFGRFLPFASGQQVKRSIIEQMMSNLREPLSPTTFVFNKAKLKEEEVYGTCDPRNSDQLIGGWMKTTKGGNERALKRRSPLSISAMRPLHPLLAGLPSEDLSFDRTNTANRNKILVRSSDDTFLSDDEVIDMLKGSNRSLNRKWIQDQKRAEGLFIYDIAIDTRRLFSVPVDQFEPEINAETISKLKDEGWGSAENDFGECLIAPEETREKIIPALANALIDWRIGSNQSRTFSLLETLVISISDNANKIAGSIRAKLTGDYDKPKAVPMIDEIDGVTSFVTLAASGSLITDNESAAALDDAKKYLEVKIRESLL